MSKLKPCPDCGTQVSPSAKSCPNCGRVNPGGASSTYRTAQILVVVVASLLVIGWMYSVATYKDLFTQQIERNNEELRRYREQNP